MLLTRPSHTRLTLALDIVKRLADGPYQGYHELATVKHQIDLHDVVSVEEAKADAIVCSDPAVPCDAGNICWKAVDLVRRRCAIDRHAAITIEKHIPVMGGLAGGSANAATTLMLLSDLWDLRLPTAQLMELGRELGMDVPFYFVGGTAFDTEAGGRLEPVTTSLTLDFVLVVPTFGVSTPQAYAGIDYAHVNRRAGETQAMLAAFRRGDAPGVAVAVHSDFERSVFAWHPALERLETSLRGQGCLAAGMSGSGSTVYGIAEGREHARLVAAAAERWPDVRRAICCRTLVAARVTS